MRANQFIPSTSDAMHESVAGPEKCWPGHRKVGTQPGTGKNAGKRVNDCEKIKKEGVAEGRATYGPITANHKAAAKKAFAAGERDGKAGAEKNKEYMSSALMKTTYLNGYKQGKQGVAEVFANPGSGSTGTARGAKRIATTVRKALAKHPETPEQIAARKDFEARIDARRAEKREQGVAEGSEEKTPGIALSKAYKKDFDDKRPGHDRPETALTGTYSKTGKPGGELKKKDVAEGNYDRDDYYNARRGSEYGRGLAATGYGGDGSATRRDDIFKGQSKRLPADPFARTTGAVPTAGTGRIHSTALPGEMDEGEKIGNMDADDFDAAMARLKKLAGAGPMKTVYDPNRRQYRNMPTAQQPAQQPKK